MATTRKTTKADRTARSNKAAKAPKEAKASKAVRARTPVESAGTTRAAAGGDARRTSPTAALEKLQRRIQREQDRLDRKRPAARKKTPGTDPVQVGAREEPGSPLPGRKLDKPGLESDLTIAPRYRAPHYLGSRKLQGMAAIVTGGDSGIGRSVAVLFAREGCDVTIVCLGSERTDAEQTKRDVENEGRKALVLVGDVRRTAFCERVVEQTLKAFGRLDVLVNNAAFQMHADRVEDLTDERIELTLETNVAGYLRMVRAAVPHMQPGASIINTGSRTGLSGSQNLIDYSATKGAIHAMTKALAKQLLERGIRVNAVAPGPVWTPLNPADKRSSDVREFGADTAFRRVAQPEELSPAYVFLASPATAGYITGIVLPVIGDVDAS